MMENSPKRKPTLGWSNEEHLASDAAKQLDKFVELTLHRAANAGRPFVSPHERYSQEERRNAELDRVHRQVALAIYCDLTYNWGLKGGAAHEHETGYSSTYWNFTLLGQTKRGPGGSKYRREQKTSRLFVIKLLNRLEERGTTVLWDKLGFNLHSARYRVIAEPSNRQMREEWRDYCRKHHIVEGVDYPAPWTVANFAGEFVTPVVDRGQVLKYDDVDRLLNVQKPGGITRGQLALFGVDAHPPRIEGEDSFTPHPRVLHNPRAAASGLHQREPMSFSPVRKGQGLKSRATKNEVEKQLQELGVALDDSLRSLRGLRELAQQEVDRERERRREVEKKYENLLNDHLKMMEEWTELPILRDRIKELEAENKTMMERGKKYRKALDDINKLSWTKGIK